MPFINVKTNTPVTASQRESVKSKLGTAIEDLGKTESWLMIGFEPEQSMYFKGSDEPCAFVDVSVFGSSSDSQYKKMTEDVCAVISGKLGISADRIYVKYSGTSQWGWNNMNF